MPVNHDATRSENGSDAPSEMCMQPKTGHYVIVNEHGNPTITNDKRWWMGQVTCGRPEPNTLKGETKLEITNVTDGRTKQVKRDHIIHILHDLDHIQTTSQVSKNDRNGRTNDYQFPAQSSAAVYLSSDA